MTLHPVRCLSVVYLLVSLLRIQAIRVDEDPAPQAAAQAAPPVEDGAPEEKAAEEQAGDTEAKQEEVKSVEPTKEKKDDLSDHNASANCGLWHEREGDLIGDAIDKVSKGDIEACKAHCCGYKVETDVAVNTCAAFKFDPDAAAYDCLLYTSMDSLDASQANREWRVFELEKTPEPTPVPTPMPSPMPTPNPTPGPGTECNTLLMVAVEQGATELFIVNASNCEVDDTVEINDPTNAFISQRVKVATVQGDDNILTVQPKLNHTFKRGSTLTHICGNYETKPGDVPYWGDVHHRFASLQQCRCACYKDTMCLSIKWSPTHPGNNCHFHYLDSNYNPDIEKAGDWELQVLHRDAAAGSFSRSL